MPTHGSLFARLGGFDLGLAQAGWTTRWQVEADPYCRRVLARHWPDVPRYADAHDLEPVDLITGSFPCQDLSVAGDRAGLRGRASGEFYDLARVVVELRPRWTVVENVPGLLFNRGGRDFEALLEALSECGYGLAWRVLDSRHFGVAQRRRRVFVVGHLGAPVPPQVLFERAGGGGPPGAGRQVAREDAQVAGPAGSGADDDDLADLARTLTARRRSDARTETIVLVGPDGQSAVAYADGMRAAPGLPRRVEPRARAVADDRCCPDGPRYAGLGRAVTVPVVRWLGERLLLAHRELYG